MPRVLDRPLLLVLGMHRSGTSALSGLLAAGGAALPQHLLAANEHNPRGFFESGRVVWVNGARLHGGGSAWDDPLLFPCASWPPAEDAHWRGLARDVFETEFGDAPWPLMKDPRLSVVLPAWRPVFEDLGLQPRCVICVRNPAAVAASLVRRDGFSAEKALLLWASYMVAAVMSTQDLPRVFVGYDALLADWRGEVGRIEAVLGWPFPARDPAAAAEADGFLTPDLRHNPGGGDLLRYGWAGKLAAEVYRALEGAMSGAVPDMAGLERAAQLLADKRREFGSIIASISRDLDMARNEAAGLRLAASAGEAAGRPTTA